MKSTGFVIAAGGTAVLVFRFAFRLVRSRHRRFLHPDGRSFSGELHAHGLNRPIGSDLIDRPGRYPITIRLSKGIGTKQGRRDIRGLAIRMHDSGTGPDLLLSSAGTGRLTARLPAVPSSFDTRYGSITAYRTGSGRKVHLAADTDSEGEPLGRTLESVADAAATHHARLLLYTEYDGALHAFGRVTFGTILPTEADAALAFDPVRRSSADLHPSGTVHGLRAFAYRLSQRWRKRRPRPTTRQPWLAPPSTADDHQTTVTADLVTLTKISLRLSRAVTMTPSVLGCRRGSVDVLGPTYASCSGTGGNIAH